MNIYYWNRMDVDEKAAVMRRCEQDIKSLQATVAPIVDAVRNDGDSALVRFTEEFDCVQLKSAQFKVKKKEFDEAEELLPKKITRAIEKAVENVRAYHEKQMPDPLWLTPVEDGVFAGEKITPITSCALYVPRGKGSFPSVMVMLGVPAVVAGVGRIAVATPPGPGGECDAATLVAARRCGIGDVYRVGGAQAVAAFAYGTKKIPKMDKIIGPGSGYVTAAKRMLFGIIDVGLPAGPSESIILADETTDPDIAATDLLIEAEHGPDSAALLVTDSEKLVGQVAAKLPALIEKLPEPRRTFCRTGLSKYGGAVVTGNIDESVRFVNDFAPEHLEVLTSDPFDTMLKIDNAGEMLIGHNTPITLGNYCLGVDAILPTGAFARTFSGVTVYDFLKRTSIGYCTEKGFDALAPTARTLAEYEGFPAHAAAIVKRQQKKTDNKNR